MNIKDKAMKIRHLLVDRRSSVSELARDMGMQQADLSRALNVETIEERLDAAIAFLEKYQAARIANESPKSKRKGLKGTQNV